MYSPGFILLCSSPPKPYLQPKSLHVKMTLYGQDWTDAKNSRRDLYSELNSSNTPKICLLYFDICKSYLIRCVWCALLSINTLHTSNPALWQLLESIDLHRFHKGLGHTCIWSHKAYIISLPLDRILKISGCKYEKQGSLFTVPYLRSPKASLTPSAG